MIGPFDGKKLKNQRRSVSSEKKTAAILPNFIRLPLRKYWNQLQSDTFIKKIPVEEHRIYRQFLKQIHL